MEVSRHARKILRLNQQARLIRCAIACGYIYIYIIDSLDMQNGEDLGFKVRKPTFKYRPEKQLSSLRIFAVSLSSSIFLDITPNARTTSFCILSYSSCHKTVQARVCANNSIVKKQQTIEKERNNAEV